MEYVLPLAVIGVAHALAAMSPGPSFVVVSRAAMTASRRHGFVAALAMGIGAALWASAALFGLAVLLARFEPLYAILRLAGGLYLIALAIVIWRGAGGQASEPERRTGPNAGLADVFRSALLTQLANPKVVVFFGSIFASLLPQGWPAWVSAAAVAMVLINETLWYCLVAAAFSTAGPRRVYQRIRAAADRALAGFLAVLGVKLILDGT